MSGFVERPTAIAQSGVGMAVLAADQNLDPLFFGIALLIAVGGGLAVLSAWWVWGRDPEVGAVAELITAPPADLPPAVAAALVADGVVGREAIAATLADLGRRGVLRVAPVRVPRSGRAHDFELRLVGSRVPLAPFERRLLDAVFGPGSPPGRTRVRLSEVRYSFAAARPEVVWLVNNELVRRGYLATGPTRTRAFLQAAGVVLMVVGVLSLWVVRATLGDVAAVAWGRPAVALLALGVLSFGASQLMTWKTPAGVAAAVRWRGFARYLKTIAHVEWSHERRELFERYLPYAIAFGVARSWVGAFSAGTTTPRWYGAGGDGGGGWGAEGGTPPEAGGGAWVIPDAQGWSDRAGASLQDASGSLSDWFDAAFAGGGGDGFGGAGDGGDGGGE